MQDIQEEDMEKIKNCIDILTNIDVYLKNRETYDENFFFDENDHQLYKDADNVIDNTKVLVSNVLSKIKYKNIEELINIIVVCYILSIKFHTDCVIYKPYTFVCNILEFDEKNVKNMVKVEKRVLNELNFFA